MKALDFIVIGAQKCATTTLFEHLRAHPKIRLPLEKEVPFFTGGDLSDAAWAAFAETHFGAPDGRLWGKVTPQYMCDPHAAERIHTRFPDVKLVAILRDPVERTWSHYQMGKRRNTEPRSFQDAVEELLQKDVLERNRALPVPTHAEGYEPESDFYVAWSEYGRVLEHYACLFGPDQLLVLYTEELEADPAGTLDRLLSFIGLEPGFRPDSLGAVIHRGGSGNRIPHGVRVWLRERRAIQALWHRLPEARRGRLRFLYEQWNVRRGTAGERCPEEARQLLQRHYSGDLQQLERLVSAPPPWMERYAPV